MAARRGEGRRARLGAHLGGGDSCVRDDPRVARTLSEMERDMEHLDENNPKAPLATDLLLGTQGWRRFAFSEKEKFAAAHGDAARRVLALRQFLAIPFSGRGGFEGGFGGGLIPRNASGPVEFAAQNKDVSAAKGGAAAAEHLADAIGVEIADREAPRDIANGIEARQPFVK